MRLLDPTQMRFFLMCFSDEMISQNDDESYYGISSYVALRANIPANDKSAAVNHLFKCDNTYSNTRWD